MDNFSGLDEMVSEEIKKEILTILLKKGSVKKYSSEDYAIAEKFKDIKSIRVSDNPEGIKLAINPDEVEGFQDAYQRFFGVGAGSVPEEILKLAKVILGFNEGYYYIRVDKILFPNTARIISEMVQVHGLKDVKFSNSGDAVYLLPKYTSLPAFSEHLYDSFGSSATVDMKIVQSTVSVPGSFCIIPEGYAFFQGPNVMDVLGRSFCFSSNNPHNIKGVPVKGFEGDSPDLSHIESRNVFMSHQSWRNYSIVTEAEIAVLQDCGIPIDRRNYYGFSTYEDGKEYHLTDDHSFYGRVVGIRGATEIYKYEKGRPNDTPLTVGLHVYGVSNRIKMCDDYRVLQSG
jgi:hypothetical protein